MLLQLLCRCWKKNGVDSIAPSKWFLTCDTVLRTTLCSNHFLRDFGASCGGGVGDILVLGGTFSRLCSMDEGNDDRQAMIFFFICFLLLNGAIDKEIKGSESVLLVELFMVLALSRPLMLVIEFVEQYCGKGSPMESECAFGVEFHTGPNVWTLSVAQATPIRPSLDQEKSKHSLPGTPTFTSWGPE